MSIFRIFTPEIELFLLYIVNSSKSWCFAPKNSNKTTFYIFRSSGKNYSIEKKISRKFPWNSKNFPGNEIYRNFLGFPGRDFPAGINPSFCILKIKIVFNNFNKKILMFQCLIPTIPYPKWSAMWTRKKSWWPGKAGMVSKCHPINPKSLPPTVFKTLFSTCNFPMTRKLHRPIYVCSAKPEKNPNSTLKNNGPSISACLKMSKKLETISFGSFIEALAWMFPPNSDFCIIIESVNLAETIAFTQKVMWIDEWFIIGTTWWPISRKS